MKNLVKNFNIILFDSISKFNIYDKKKILKMDNLKIYVKLKSLDTLFLKNFLFLSKIYFYLFKRKIIILKVLQDFSKLNKFKNSLIFYVGITYKDQASIFNILNYLLNIVTFSSKKSDDFFNFKKKENNFLYFFKNNNNNFILNKKIVNFYEKLFF